MNDTIVSAKLFTEQVSLCASLSCNLKFGLNNFMFITNALCLNYIEVQLLECSEQINNAS